MPSFHVFLRLLLCIALIFYGSGPAAAAVTMEMASAGVAATTAASTDTESGRATAAPCHDAAAMGKSAVPDPSAGMDDGADTAMSMQGSPDCCKTTGCECSCAQHVQVATMTSVVGSAVPACSTAVRPMETGHASPALPLLIRPPIG